MQIEIIFVWRNRAKTLNIVSKTCVNIKFFFIELLYEINITFVIMLLFGRKKSQSSFDTD